MNCLQCSLAFDESRAAEVSPARDPRRRLIKCPHCDAFHLREDVMQKKQVPAAYTYRLWGHPATTRRVQVAR